MTLCQELAVVRERGGPGHTTLRLRDRGNSEEGVRDNVDNHYRLTMSLKTYTTVNIHTYRLTR